MYRIGALICTSLLLHGCVVNEPFAEQQKKPRNGIEIPPARKPPERIESPAHTLMLKGSPEEANLCLKNAIQKTFKIPDEFIELENFSDGTANISLINPTTETVGVSIDLRPEINPIQSQKNSVDNKSKTATTKKLSEKTIQTENKNDDIITQKINNKSKELVNAEKSDINKKLDTKNKTNNSEPIETQRKTEAKMYANGTTISKAWSRILPQCD